MKVVTLVRFDDAERAQIRDALVGLLNDRYDRLIQLRHRAADHAHAKDAFAPDWLHECIEELTELHAELEPQQDPAWWRRMGAFGEDDAIQGLADGRVRNCEDLRHLMGLLGQAVAVGSIAEAVGA
jgi:hypothetical protein